MDMEAARALRRLKYRLGVVRSDLTKLAGGVYPHRLVDLGWVRGALCLRERELRDSVYCLIKSREERRKERNG